MTISEKAIELIKDFEGFRSDSYVCPAGLRTIGYGHVQASEDLRTNITADEAEELLLGDILKAELSLSRNINVALTQGQLDALISFTFNVGAAALQRSTLRQKVNRGEHEVVPGELKKWIYANGVILPGLIKRRNIEAEIYLT